MIYANLSEGHWLCLVWSKLDSQAQKTWQISCFQFCSSYTSGFVPGNLTLQLFSVLFWLHHWLCPRKLDTSAVFSFVVASHLALSMKTWRFSCFQFCSGHATGFVSGNLTLQLFVLQFCSGFVIAKLTVQLFSALFWLHRWDIPRELDTLAVFGLFSWPRYWVCLRKLDPSAVFSFIPATPLGYSPETCHMSCFQFYYGYTTRFVSGNLTLQLFSVLFWPHLWVCSRKLDITAVFSFVLATPLGLSQKTWHYSCFQFCSSYTSGFVSGNLTHQLFSVLFWVGPRKPDITAVFSFVLATRLGLSQETWHISCFQFCSGLVPENLTFQLFSVLFWLHLWVCPRKLDISAVFSFFFQATPLGLSQKTWHCSCFHFYNGNTTEFEPEDFTLQLFSDLFWLRHWVFPRKLDFSAVFGFDLATPLGLSQKTLHFSCFQFCSGYATGFVLDSLRFQLFSALFLQRNRVCSRKLDTSVFSVLFWLRNWFCPSKFDTSAVSRFVLATQLSLRKPVTLAVFSIVLATPLVLSQETIVQEFSVLFWLHHWVFSWNDTLFSVLFWQRHWVIPRKLDTPAVFSFVLVTPLGYSQETWHFSCFQVCSGSATEFVPGNLTLQLFSVLFW